MSHFLKHKLAFSDIQQDHTKSYTNTNTHTHTHTKIHKKIKKKKIHLKKLSFNLFTLIIFALMTEKFL